VEIARRDGWGVAKPEGKTKGQIAAEAAEDDFRRMKAWVDDEWWWAFLRVTLLDVDGNETSESESIGGLESDDEDGIAYYTKEMAESIAERVKGQDVLVTEVRIREAA
jgi:hypothetical protein